jgi:hypothetical protein
MPKLEMEFLGIVEQYGEKDMGIAAAMIVAVNEINGAPDPKLFGDCQPDIALHLKDHQGDVTTAAKIALVPLVKEENNITGRR